MGVFDSTVVVAASFYFLYFHSALSIVLFFVFCFPSRLSCLCLLNLFLRARADQSVAPSYDICCDLPRGKFPYLVCNLVVFGHRTLSCVTQATLETRVCHSRVYFNSRPTPLLWFYLLLSTSPSAFPSLPVHINATQSPPQCRRNRLLLAENPQLALHKVCISHLSITCNGSMAREEMLLSSHFVVQISPFGLPIFSNTVCVFDYIFLCKLFFTIFFFFLSRPLYTYTDCVRPQPERMLCPYFRSHTAGFPW